VYGFFVDYWVVTLGWCWRGGTQFGCDGTQIELIEWICTDFLVWLRQTDVI
jgi:hypothetical protein